MDGGGTRTRGAVADLSGRLLARLDSGASNPHVVGFPSALATLRTLANQLLAQVGSSTEEIAGWCCGLAGVDRARDREPFLGLAEEFRCGDRLLVTTDALIALAGATLSDRGILVHAGTGSIVYGRDEDSTARVGGWGRLLDDNGSGYALGRAAVRAIMRAYDGREIATSLRDAILEPLGLTEETDLVHWSSTAGQDATQVAALAPFVLRCAEAGDPVAARLVDEAADDLVLMVRALAQTIPIKGQTQVVLSGGVFENSGYYRELVTRKLRFYYPDLPVGQPKMEPVAGALLYALNRGDVRINRALLETLQAGFASLASPAVAAVPSTGTLGGHEAPPKLQFPESLDDTPTSTPPETDASDARGSDT